MFVTAIFVSNIECVCVHVYIYIYIYILLLINLRYVHDCVVQFSMALLYENAAIVKRSVAIVRQMIFDDIMEY